MRAMIVEEGSVRASLAAVRALHEAGWEVGIGSPTRTGLAASSRSASRWHYVPALSDGRGRFLEAVATAGRTGRYEVVFAAGDAELLALSSDRQALPMRVPYAPHATVLRALDKLQLAQAAGAVGIATPLMHAATSERLARIDRPMVVKARMHAAPGRKGVPTRIETRIVRTSAEAEQRAGEIRAAGGEPILQERLTGQLVEYVVLLDRDARVVARVQQLAERIWPPEAGISARAHTMAVDRELAERVEALMAELGWSGLAQLQFLLTPDGRLRLIDLNGRFYGSLALAVAAGVNLPALWAALATGRAVGRGFEARPGVRYQWLEGDLRSVFLARDSHPLRDTLGCFCFARGAVHSVWRKEDPLPAIRHIRVLLGRAARKVLGWPSRS
jgi:predicted ATP-grasp superfamily ATP-dependent carboligase